MSGAGFEPAPVFSRMTYYHWASDPVNLRRMDYPQQGHPKPNGFWFDVDGSWKHWCETVQFRLEKLHYRHTVTVLDTSRILILRKANDIDRFTQEYGHNLSGHFQSLQSSEERDEFAQEYGSDLFADVMKQFSNYIMWEEVAEKYSGIVLDPYLHSKSQAYLWYHGWNCAGGCIWATGVARLGKPCDMAR